MNLNNEMKLWQYFFLLLYVFDAAFVDATKVAPQSIVTPTSASEYSSSLQWQCDNGEFIQTDQLCDGGAHCSDASDETAEHCIHIFCPQYAFRCAYGACITGTSKCDNHQDCIDNSDENRFLCGWKNVHELERQLSGTCNGSGSMQCKSGECINIEKRCDGLKDCHDGSDETVELCSYMYCPKYAFRCGYGGCIRGSAKCDGFADCVDASDEAGELCRFERRKPGDKKPEPKPIVSRPSNGCLIPFNRRALLAMHSHNGTLLRLGIRVPVGSQITFACEERNCALEGYQQNSCLEMGTWQYPVPFCAKYCAHTTLTKGISTSVSCTHEHKSVNCSAQLRVGTTAQVRCAPGYELPRNRPHIVDKLTCDADGEWDYPKFKCKPQCGMTPRNVTTAIIERPWHVTIYSRVLDGTLLSVCGGAIIAPNLIITGAECFVDDMNRLQDDPIFYNLMLGHHLRELSAGEYRLKQLHNISQILLSDSDFLEPNDDYKHGVALLVLVNHIDFAESAKPICLNFEKSVVHSEPHQQLMLSPQQQLELGYINKGYAFAEAATGRRATLTAIVEEFNEESGAVTIINVNHYKKFIKKIIRRYKYIL